MITPQLQVAVQLAIGTLPPIPVTNLTGDGLRIDWSVTKQVGPSIDSATVTVYNLDPTLRKAIAAAMVTRAWAVPIAHARPSTLPIQLFVGWGGMPMLLFQGEAWKVEPEKHNGNDILTIITAGDGGPALRDTPPAGGSLGAAAVQLVVQQILATLGYTPSPAAFTIIAERAASLPLTSYVAVNDPHEDLDNYMASLGLSWGISDGFFVVYDGGLRNDLPQLQLSPGVGGLISWEPLDDGGLSFQALADARLVPGRQVLFADHLNVPISPPLRVESVTFDGTTDGYSTMSGIARKVQILG